MNSSHTQELTHLCTFRIVMFIVQRSNAEPNGHVLLYRKFDCTFGKQDIKRPRGDSQQKALPYKVHRIDAAFI